MVGETLTTTYMKDLETNEWTSTEGPNNPGEVGLTFDKDTYVDKDGYMVSETEEAAFKFESTKVTQYDYKDNAVVTDGAITEIYDFGTTKVTIPTVTSPEGPETGPEDTTELDQAIALLNSTTSYETKSIMDMGIMPGFDMPAGMMIIESTIKVESNKAHEVAVTKISMKVGSDGQPELDGDGNPMLNLDSDGNPMLNLDSDGNPIYVIAETVETFVVDNGDDTYNVYAEDEMTGEMTLSENVHDDQFGTYAAYFETEEIPFTAADFTPNGDIYTASITEEGMTISISIDLTNGVENMNVAQEISIGGIIVIASGSSKNFNKTTVTLPTIS